MVAPTTRARASSESAWIGTLHEGRVLVIHHVFRPDDSLQLLQVGMLLPTHATALGKVLLAFDPYAEACVPMAALTPKTIVSPIALDAELDRVRDRGWAGELEELEEGEAAIAAPIRDKRGLAVGAIGIRGAIERLTSGGDLRTELVSYVRDAARAVTRDLAH